MEKVSLFAVILGLSSSIVSCEIPPARATPMNVAVPVVVELFTSQGCSSCPPADALLSRLGGERNVIALAFHVDYWNHIGWTDPFSSREWSERQGRYSSRFGLGQVYTPQAVVQGSTQLVGSSERAVRQAILDQSKIPPTFEILLEAHRKGDAIHIAAKSRNLDSKRSGVVDIHFVLYQKTAVTNVGRGENDGRTLRNSFIVRKIARVPLEIKGTAQASTGRTLTVDVSWQREELGVAAFVQDPKTLRIFAAATAAIR